MKKKIALALAACMMVSGCGGPDNEIKDNTLDKTQITADEDSAVIEDSMSVETEEEPSSESMETVAIGDRVYHGYIPSGEFSDSGYCTTHIADDIVDELDKKYNLTAEHFYSGNADILVIQNPSKTDAEGRPVAHEFRLNDDRFTKKIIIEEDTGETGVPVLLLECADFEQGEKLDKIGIISSSAAAIANAVNGTYPQMDYANMSADNIELYELKFIMHEAWRQMADTATDAVLGFHPGGSYKATSVIGFGEEYNSSYLTYEVLYNDDTGCYSVTADDYDYIIGTFYAEDYFCALDMATDILNHMAAFYNEHMTPETPFQMTAAEKKESNKKIRSTADICIMMSDYAKTAGVDLDGSSKSEVDFYTSMSGVSLDGFDYDTPRKQKGCNDIQIMKTDFYFNYEPTKGDIIVVPGDVYNDEEMENYWKNPLLRVNEEDFESTEAMAAYIWNELSD